MRQISKRLALLTSGAMLAVAIAGCSNSDVELKGGLFDLMGVNGSQGSASEPKLASRPGIVMPPATASLPKPGGPPKLVTNGEAFPVNPEEAKKAQVADVVKRHKAFCERARQRHDAGLTETIENSPWGSCHRSVLRNLTGTDLSGNKRVGSY